MPYFVYQIEPPLTLTFIDAQGVYKDARALVRRLRSDQPDGNSKEFRMVFAKSQGEAEKLLSTPRDERVIGEDCPAVKTVWMLWDGFNRPEHHGASATIYSKTEQTNSALN